MLSTADSITTPVSVGQYFVAHVHLAQCWKEKRTEELAWFLASLRGELPEPKKPLRNWTVKHISLPPNQYYPALEALTTRLGVKLP